MVYFLQIDDAMAAAGRLRETEVHRLLARNRRLDLFHPVDLLEFALRLRSLAGLGAKAIGELLERRDFFLLVLVGGELLFFARRLLFDVAVPVSAVAVQAAMRDLDDGTDELVQEFAIVRDHEDRAGIIRQIFLEPDERFEVEMVRGFVEQEQLRLLHQQAREMGAHHPAAAKRLRRPIEIRFAKGEARENALGFGLELPAAMFVKSMQRFVVFRRIFRRRLQDSLRLRQFRRNGAGQLEHRFIAGRRMFLREISNGGRFFQRYFAFVRRSLAENEAEKRRFAGAVRSHQAHAIATIDLERRLFKKRAAAKGFCNLGNREHASGGECRESARQRKLSTV